MNRDFRFTRQLTSAGVPGLSVWEGGSDLKSCASVGYAERQQNCFVKHRTLQRTRVVGGLMVWWQDTALARDGVGV